MHSERDGVFEEESGVSHSYHLINGGDELQTAICSNLAKFI